MSFYLLKGDYQSQKVGQTLINLDEVESIAMAVKQYKDLANPLFLIMVTMKSKDTWNARFTTLGAAKQLIKEMLGDKVLDQDLEDFLPQTRD